MKTVTIRAAIPADTPAMEQVAIAAYAEARARIADLPDVTGGLGADIAQNHVWVGKIDGKLVGFAVLVLTANSAKLANIAVHPNSGGAGIGRALINQVEAATIAAGLRELSLVTHRDMPENVALYTRLGWNEVDRRGAGVVMRKTL